MHGLYSLKALCLPSNVLFFSPPLPPCSQLFIWQAHNALFMIRCLLKVFIREMSEEELHLQFSYQERAPGSCGGELEEAWVGLIQEML